MNLGYLCKQMGPFIQSMTKAVWSTFYKILSQTNTDDTSWDESIMGTLIVDGMTIVHELMAVKNFKYAKDLAEAYVKLVYKKNAKGHIASRIVFDIHTKSLSENTREQQRGKMNEMISFRV